MTGPSLAGRIALVTGSSRGIGRASAVALAMAGADVAVHYHKNRALAEQTASEVEQSGRRAVLVQADLERPEDIERLFHSVGEAFGGLDILVANAAATAFKPALEVKEHHLDRTYDLIVRGFVFSAQQAALLMEGRPQSRIIAISGHGTEFTLPNYGLLGSAKAAVEVWTRYLAAELGPKGITVNCLSPGVIATDSAAFYFGERYRTLQHAVAKATPLGRIGQPEDVAGAVLLLASELSGFVTGQVIRVDGGMTLTSGPFEEVR